MKKIAGLENYLLDIKNVTLRVILTKFRISDHNLMIEAARYKKIEAEFRFCPFCPKLVESEIHFLLVCNTFKQLREKFLYKMNPSHPFLQYFSNENKFLFLLSKHMESAPFIQQMFELWTFLLAKHKRLI